MTPQELLEKIQNAQHGGIEVDQEDKLNRYINRLRNTREFELTAEQQEKMIESLRRAAQSLPTKFQDISSYNILLDRFLGLQDVLGDGNVQFEGQWNVKPKSIPVFGTVVMPRFNAFITPTEDTNDALIIFSESLITFARTISKCISLAMPISLGEDDMVYFSTDVEQVKASLAQNQDTISYFVDLMFSYMLTN